MDSDIDPKVAEIDNMVKDICGLARDIATQLSEGRQAVASIRKSILAAELELPEDAELLLKPSATALANLETMTTGIRRLFDSNSLDSSSSRKKLEACDPSIDAAVLKSDIESLEGNVAAIKDDFQKLSRVVPR